ncbi:MAG: ACT domain-containing protein, partial [Eubacteriales bacterium]|nr:ACT domain-containing protein [Eubacteriales bacterium]
PDGSIVLEHSAQQLQLVCPMGAVPPQARCEHNWRMFSIQGPLAFAQAGIMKSINALFSRNAVEAVCLPGSRSDKGDYILVRSHKLETAIELLRQNYYDVQSSSRM